MEAVFISKCNWNYLKDDGTYLLDEHVYKAYDFNEGLALIKYINLRYNYVNLEGKKLLKTDINNGYSFYNGLTYIKINNVWYYIDKECNFYSYENKVSFKELYNNFPNIRSELIEIIEKYTYHNVDEYFNI